MGSRGSINVALYPSGEVDLFKEFPNVRVKEVGGLQPCIIGAHFISEFLDPPLL